jgi:hypothetical protein
VGPALCEDPAVLSGWTHVGGWVGELTWKGRSMAPLPSWFTLGRDPP